MAPGRVAAYVAAAVDGEAAAVATAPASKHASSIVCGSCRAIAGLARKRWTRSR